MTTASSDDHDSAGKPGVELSRRFQDLAEELAAGLTPAGQEALPQALRHLPDWRTARDFGDLGPVFQPWYERISRSVGGPMQVGLFRAALVATLGVGLDVRLVDRDLPVDVLSQVPPALERLLAFLQVHCEGYRRQLPDDDYFLKDIRFVTGLTVPCGARVVDLRSRIGRRRSLVLATRGRSLQPVTALLRGGSLEPWLTPHVDTRYLDEFDEQGWRRAHLRMASILRRQPEVRGVAATSWFYDPEVATVSPHLAYLRRRPVEAGAISIAGRPGALDVRAATSTSSARARLYREGRYQPRPYTLLWQRRELLRWAYQEGALTPAP